MTAPPAAPRFGLVLSDPGTVSAGRPQDPVHWLLLQWTLVDLPRAAGAKRQRAAVRERHPHAQIAPYVWHWVSHGPRDGLRHLGTRRLQGPPEAFGELRETPEAGQAWEGTRQATEAFGASHVVLRTPASIGPGALGTERIRRFVEARRAQGVQVIWEPEGLWEPDQAARLAAALGVPWITPAIVSGRVVDDPPPGAWLRIGGPGVPAELDGRRLDPLADLAERDGERVLLLGGPKAHANLRKLARVLTD